MGDHFVLLVDRLLTESTLGAAIESRRQSMEATSSSSTDDLKRNKSTLEMEFEDIPSSKKMVECRICQDEDEDSNMETPCSCRGSLKYAHRRCIQKWCNEKGNTVCEICQQQFKPGYTAPPSLFEMRRIPMNFRGNWEMSRRDSDSPTYITMVSSNRNVADSDYDEIAASAASSVLCCHSIAITFMVLLVLRHTLPLMFNEASDYSFPMLLLICLRIFGICLLIYVMFKVVTAVHRRRLLLPTSSSSPITSSSIARSSMSQSPQPQPNIIRVR
ncbi:E3 ubiquitin-protein ligase MARCH8-like [Cucurbita pepo subsp. pepo]|uniref:E3 ubiquitin-protein ligase MARCH8-like n=1 Tax=Cucurbita pepo subsp. pepo TaxID=3664 RepID=UPI000C9D800A|nr:E3 ubiquitin-protein ligase MARCH8-like [Cucurbita pepo subsp. pepo]XP_023549808.1 E3 ubiquitin-protein ligase MARCH8-like [Cucurbita pepo subsp. pepo]